MIDWKWTVTFMLNAALVIFIGAIIGIIVGRVIFGILDVWGWIEQKFRKLIRKKKNKTKREYPHKYI